MSYVLIFWLIASQTNFASTGSAVFADEASCNAALKAIAATWIGDGRGAPGVCTPQSTVAPAPTAAPSAATPSGSRAR